MAGRNGASILGRSDEDEYLDPYLESPLTPGGLSTNELGKVASYHNNARLAAAHSLGMMPDYLHGLISFSEITGCITINGVTANEDTQQGRLSTACHFDDPIIYLAVPPGRRSYKINHKRFTSLWTRPHARAKPLVDFNKKTGLIEFAGLDFDRQWALCRPKSLGYQPPPDTLSEFRDGAECESQLWKEFGTWRARYKNSAFITTTWEPLEKMRQSLPSEGGRGFDGDAKEVVSTAIKRHYKLIALFHSLCRYMHVDSHAQKTLEREEVDHHLNPFAVIHARLGEVTGFDGVYPSDAALLNFMLPRWKEFFPQIKDRMGKVVRDFCPEAPRIAQHLLEEYGFLRKISVHLNAENFCPWLYFDQPQDDPHLDRRAVFEDHKRSLEDAESPIDQGAESEAGLFVTPIPDSEEQMSEDDSDWEDEMSEDD